MPEDRSWVTFTLGPEARWHDGKPITAEDVIFSFETLTTKGHPHYRSYYANVVKAEKTGEREVTFTFDGGVNRELPLIIGAAAGAAEALLRGARLRRRRRSSRRSAAGPTGSSRSSPAARSSTSACRTIGARICRSTRGRYNFDAVRYEYYRDANVALEAFKAGELRLPARELRQALGDRLRPAQPFEQRADRQGGAAEPAGSPACRASCSTPARGRCSRIRGCARRWPTPSTSSGPTRTCSTARTSARELLPRRTRELASSGLPSEAELALLEPLSRPDARRRSSPRTTSRRSTDGRGNTARQPAPGARLLQRGRLGGRGRPAGQSARPASRMAFEILLVSPRVRAHRAALRQEPQAPRHRGARSASVDTAQYQNRDRQLRFRHDHRRSGGRASRPATSSATTGARRPPTCPAAATRRHQGSRRRRADRGGDPAPRRATTWRPPSARSTACCCGATTWSRTGTIQAYRVAYWNKFGRPEVMPAGRPRPVRVVGRPGQGAALRSGQSMEGGARAADGELSGTAEPCSPTSSAGCC